MRVESEILKRHIEALKKMSGKKVEAGWFESDRYGAGKGKTVGNQVAFIARINNFGATVTREVNGKKVVIVIPARAFMQLAYSNFLKNRKAIQDRILNRVLDGKIKPEQALAQFGQALEGEIAKSIKNGGWQKNADSTIAKKGFDKPLIDSGHMWKTVNSKVT